MRRWLIWTIVVIGWSVALEVPIRTPDLPGGEWILTKRYLIAKSMHVSVYAFITILTGWLTVQTRYRVLLMFFLMLHASMTELLQHLLEEHFHRGGELKDVCYDHLGIAIGFAISWKWWTRPDVPTPIDPVVERTLD